jgi:hypothetical protein
MNCLKNSLPMNIEKLTSNGCFSFSIPLHSVLGWQSIEPNEGAIHRRGFEIQNA